MELRDGVSVAKRWLVELIGSSSLREAASVPAARLAQDGPALCAAYIAALESDPALDALAQASQSARAGSLAGASDPAGIAKAVTALQAAAWGALRANLSEPGGDLMTALSERMAEVSAVILERSLGGASPRPAPAFRPTEESVRPPAAVVPEPQSEREVTVSQPTAGAPSPSGESWRATIERRVARAGEREPFAVLTAELDDIDRIIAAGSGKEVATAIDAAERAMIDSLAPADVLVRERVGRYWIVSSAEDHQTARALGERVAVAVSDAASIAGTPLAVSVGLAMHPEDGEDGETLAATADEALFAARAAGIRIA